MNAWVRHTHVIVLASVVLLLMGACAASAQPRRFQIFADNAGQQPPAFAGIGAVLDVEVDQKTNEEHTIIGAVMPGMPAEKAGVQPSDRILEIDGEPVEGLTLGEVAERIRGEEGTEVKLTLLRKGEDEPIEVEIVRGRIGPTPNFMGAMPGRPGGMMGPMVGMMPPPQPVMLIDQGYLYIITGNVLYKVDADTLEQINAVHLIPPPALEGIMGIEDAPWRVPPPPPPPPAP